MDALPQLLPIGGASAVFIVLLRILLHERAQWTRDRAELVVEHREYVDEMERRHEQATRYWEQLVKTMATRIEALEGEVAKLRAELRSVLGGVPDEPPK